jgi:hypothetical protein
MPDETVVDGETHCRKLVKEIPGFAGPPDGPPHSAELPLLDGVKSEYR